MIFLSDTVSALDRCALSHLILRHSYRLARNGRRKLRAASDPSKRERRGRACDLRASGASLGGPFGKAAQSQHSYARKSPTPRALWRRKAREAFLEPKEPRCGSGCAVPHRPPAVSRGRLRRGLWRAFEAREGEEDRAYDLATGDLRAPCRSAPGAGRAERAPGQI